VRSTIQIHGATSVNIIDSIYSTLSLDSRRDIATALLIQYNVRASEVLRARYTDFYYPDFLILRGSKKSRDIVVRDRQLLARIHLLPALHQDLIFYPLKYSQLYHFVRSRYDHLLSRFKGRKNNKVTHAFRYAAASRVSQDEDITLVLNHRSSKSRIYYQSKK